MRLAFMDATPLSSIRCSTDCRDLEQNCRSALILSTKYLYYFLFCQVLGLINGFLNCLFSFLFFQSNTVFLSCVSRLLALYSFFWAGKKTCVVKVLCLGLYHLLLWRKSLGGTNLFLEPWAGADDATKVLKIGESCPLFMQLICSFKLSHLLV